MEMRVGETACWMVSKGIENELVARHLIGCALQEVVDSMADHEEQQFLHYWFGLHVQLAQHLI